MADRQGLRKKAAEEAAADAFVEQVRQALIEQRIKTFTEFKAKFGAENGEGAFSGLQRVKPEIANTIRGKSAIDPYTEDRNLPAFWRHVEAAWKD